MFSYWEQMMSYAGVTVTFTQNNTCISNSEPFTVFNNTYWIRENVSNGKRQNVDVIVPLSLKWASLTSLCISSVCWTLWYLFFHPWFLVGRSACVCWGWATVHCVREGKTHQSERVFFLHAEQTWNICCIQYMDDINNKEKVNTAVGWMHTWMFQLSRSCLLMCLCVCVCVFVLYAQAHSAARPFTGCSCAGAVFIQSWPLAVEAAMARTLALQRANLWWAVMLLAGEVGVGLGEWRARRLGNWHWTAG